MDKLTNKIKTILLEMDSSKNIEKTKGRLSEAIHHQLQELLDHPDIDAKDKMNFVSGMARNLIASGEESGLESDDPKTGSSRAVFFPKDPKKINLDGHDVDTHSVVKIAFPGHLDKYNKSGKLLGEHQNEVESDRSINNDHSVIRQDPDTGHWHTNPNGILPPHFGHHSEHHYLEMGRVEPLTEDSFKEATKTESHPEGISHHQFERAIDEHWHQAHGADPVASKRLQAAMEHPLVKKTLHMVANSDINPGDFHSDNMGLWKHPVTGKKQVVISDFGFSNKVAKHYLDARTAKYQQEEKKK